MFKCKWKRFCCFSPGAAYQCCFKSCYSRNTNISCLLLALTVCGEIWNMTLLFPFGLFSLATKVDMSALKFGGFLLLLIHILIGWRPVIKEQQQLLRFWSQEPCWLHKILRVRCGFGCELQMLHLQWEEKLKLRAWISTWFWWNSLKC